MRRVRQLREWGQRATRVSRCALALPLAAGVLACSARGGESRREAGDYTVTGVVVAVRPDVVSVAHDEIPGYMAAMTMPFTLHRAGDGASLTPGDRVRYRLRLGPDGPRAGGFDITGRDTAALKATA